MLLLSTLIKVSLLAFTIACGGLEGRQDGGLTLTDEDKAFFAQLREAVVKNDRPWVADHVSFPLSVTTKSAKKILRTRQEFLSDFDRIFDTTLKRVLESQEPDRLFKNWRGVM